MSDNSTPTVADLLGVGRSFPYQGKDYEIRELELAEQMRFAKWLKDRNKLDAVRTPDATEAEQDKLLAAAIKVNGSGWFDVDGPGYVEAMATPAGTAEALFITLSRDHPEVTREVAQDMVETGLRDTFLRMVAAEGGDPKALEVLCRTLGFPADYLQATASTRPSSSSDSPTRPTTGDPGKSDGSPTPNSSDSSPSNDTTTAAPS